MLPHNIEIVLWPPTAVTTLHPMHILDVTYLVSLRCIPRVFPRSHGIDQQQLRLLLYYWGSVSLLSTAGPQQRSPFCVLPRKAFIRSVASNFIIHDALVRVLLWHYYRRWNAWKTRFIVRQRSTAVHSAIKDTAQLLSHEVTTLWGYRNECIIIIFFKLG